MTGFKLPNFTQVPNELFEMMHSMSDSELRVVLALLRQTSGYGREQANFGIAKIGKMTGLAHNSVTKGAREAQNRGVVRRLNPGEKRSAQWLIKWDKTPSNFEGGRKKHHQNLRETPSVAEGQVGLNKKERKELKKSPSPAYRRDGQAKQTAQARYKNGRLVLEEDTE